MENNPVQPASPVDQNLQATAPLSPVTEAQTQTPPIPPTPDSPIQSPESSQSNNIIFEYKKKPSHLKYFVLLMVFILMFLIIIGGTYILGKNNLNKQSPTPSPTPVVAACTKEIKICPDGVTSVGRKGPSCNFEKCPETSPEKTMKTYESTKIPNLSFSGYSIQHPAAWIETITRDNTAGTSKFTITKGDYSINIYQAPVGGAQCVFEGEMPVGPSADYRKETTVELTTNFGSLLRVNTKNQNGESEMKFCQKNEQDNSYGNVTTIGIITYNTPLKPDEEIISEMNEILTSIQTN